MVNLIKSSKFEIHLNFMQVLRHAWHCRILLLGDPVLAVSGLEMVYLWRACFGAK
jgi:hypothetical protein